MLSLGFQVRAAYDLCANISRLPDNAVIFCKNAQVP
jgi:hypothetical protein